MGGIGKTTLAINIFNDSLVAYHFHTRVWITVSQNYHLREVLLALVASLTDQKTLDLSKKKDEKLAEHVYKNLKGRTYFIVMDDMWSTKTWDDVRKFFSDDNNGSRVLITTRLSDVAVYASSSPLHHMHFLSEEWSWNLLRHKVLEQQNCPPELERIGRTIAKSCGGLPLAIAVVSGILAKVDRTQYHWEKIVENISAIVATNDGHFSKILTLSYNRLPCHLKACFLYMGGFLEDYRIPVSKLTKLWIVEGFLKSSGPKSIEEFAEECLKDLVKRNLVLIIKKRSNGKIRFCGLHDLVRDLFLALALNNYEPSGRLMVPPSISNLQSLQTLMIRVYGWERGNNILLLQIEMWEMPQLRHLIFFHGSRLPTPLAVAPSGRQVLENLQTFCVDNFRFTSNVIERFPNLKKLKVYYADASGRAGAKYCLKNLVHLCQLETLNLMFYSMYGANPLPSSFAFPPNLKKLTLSGCDIPWRRMVIIRSCLILKYSN
ncbi:putative late blight resistance proteinR1B-8 [Sesamum alatum]|uniref:Late blight resistance proteinR1B-8 n=1 Tax=Sesamum alatum TaxID=300844 RepID=A0AAE1XML2_9LAMI|nr:putative late blight resistance proteinR1B-8 [Sesamum alatum]